MRNSPYLTITALFFLVIGCSNPEAETKQENRFKTEQLYKGSSKRGTYLCYLKISPENKVTFTYATPGNEVYGEHSGTIKVLNDSTFHVSCELTFGQFVCKALALDTLSIFVNPPSLIDKKSILVRYENEDLMTNPKITKSGLAFAFDDRLFNEYTPAYILTDHTHPITGEALTIKASFGSGYDFVRGDKLDFDIVISGDSLYTIGDDSSLQTGHFQLKKQAK
jgi:hypothetical protein